MAYLKLAVRRKKRLLLKNKLRNLRREYTKPITAENATLIHKLHTNGKRIIRNERRKNLEEYTESSLKNKGIGLTVPMLFVGSAIYPMLAAYIVYFFCCNLFVGVALNARFTTNGMCAKNNTRTYVARTTNNRVIAAHDLYCCLLPQCEALRTCYSGFPIATK